MKLQTIIGVLAGRLAHFILKRQGRGTTFPGKIALQFDPFILRFLSKNYHIIVVTGTNGKTVTTSLAATILKEHYGAILTNPSGANMISGITSTFLMSPKKKTAEKQWAILEVDEASLSKVCDFLSPSLFVLTNIFRDQMDRFGEIYTTYQLILDAIAKAPHAHVLLNADSPLFQSKHLPNPVSYYGFDIEKHSPTPAHYNTEGILCPRCQHILRFYFHTYANLGDYICLECGFSRPKPKYALTDLTHLTNTSSQFVIDKQSYTIQVGGLYNIYNALAAVAIAEHLMISPSTIKKGLENSQAVFGRQETFQIKDKQCTLLLMKNPVGATQLLEMMKLTPSPFSLAVLLNAHYADGIDTSWIWDADFEQLANMEISHIYAGGTRSTEIARRIRVAGYPPEQLTQSKDLKSILSFIAKQTNQQVYILATYTAMLAFRDLLAKQDIINKEMM